MRKLGTFLVMEYSNDTFIFPNILITATDLQIYNLALTFSSLQHEKALRVVRRDTQLIDVTW